MLARLVGKTFMLSTNLSGPQLICRHFSVAVVALLDRGLQGAPQPLRGLGAALGLALASFCLALGALIVAVLAELFAQRPADRRAHRGDVAQQEVEVVAAPVVKDHGDGLGRLGRDVAGVAQRPEILPGAVAVELLLSGLESKDARHSLQ